MLRRRAFLTVVAFLSPLARIMGVAQSFSLEDFVRLSSRLTGRTDLDRAAAAAILKGSSRRLGMRPG